MMRNRAAYFGIALAVSISAGCSSADNPNSTPDMTAHPPHPDPSSPDLSADHSAAPDMAPVFLPDGGGILACTPATTGVVTNKFVMNAMFLPQDSHSYSYDLVGATPPKPLNALGDIVSAMAAANLDVQAEATKEVNAGQVVQLFTTTSTDPTLTTDACAATVVNTGKPTSTPPDFTQVQMFAIDPTVVAGGFSGPLASNRFSSGATATTVPPVMVHFELPMVPGIAAPLLPIYGAHIQWTFMSGGLAQGQLNGAIKKSDINKTVIPNIAASLTNKIATDKASPGGLNATDMQILQIFDVGGCTNPDGSKAVGGDLKIDTCEVANNSLIQAVLKPDVALFDANGNWKPNPHATAAQRDCLSVGFAFTAVPAQF